MAAAEGALLARLEPVLPALPPLVGRQPVLDEVQGPAGLEHASQLEQRGLDIGDRAQRPGRQRGVAAVVGEGQRLAIQSGPLDRHIRAREPLAGELPADVRGLDRRNAADSARIEGNVESRPEANLDDPSVEALADPLPLFTGDLHRAYDVHDAR